MTKQELFERGKAMVQMFVKANDIDPVRIVEQRISKHFGVCGYYRDSVIYIDLPKCANIGYGGRSWSYPGYVVDRTPYGVLAHELGHHVDKAHGRVPGFLSTGMRERTQEDAITGYAENTNEWFAEIFRLYVTNPDLLRKLRPKMFNELNSEFEIVELRKWEDVVLLDRQRNAAKNKIARAAVKTAKLQMPLY